MAVTHGLGSKIYVGKYDMSGEGRSIDITADVDLADATVFTSAAKEWIPGPSKYTIEHSGVFDITTAYHGQWLYDNLAGATGQGITIVPGTPTQYSSVTYNGMVKEANHKIPVKVEDLVGINASYQVSGAMSRGLLVAYQTTAVGAFSGTAVDLGAAASATQMWVLCIHIYEFNINAATSYTVKIQSATTLGGSYGDVAGCTKTATAADSLYYAKAGALNQYVKVIGTPTGGAETAKFVVSLGIVNLQDTV
jgi:hypothetical protein